MNDAKSVFSYMKHSKPQTPSSSCAQDGSTWVREILIALNASSGLGRATICRLAGCVDDWARCATRDLPGLARSLEVPVAQIERARASIGQASQIARRELEAAEELGGTVLTMADSCYPPALFELELPPPVLYSCGVLPANPAVAIVGPRNPDPYGREAARLFARGLATSGLVVVSGFARGVDAVAHRSALETPGGQTVAVLGCGLGINYPRQHNALFGEIAASGSILTEFPSGCPPRPWHFPVRNRLIAALSAGTVVIQATLRSGALITARYALDLGRDVWAVPGRIFDSRSAGTNALIRDGAHLVEHPRDVVDCLSLELKERLEVVRAETLTPSSLTKSGLRRILDALEPGQVLAPEQIADQVEMTLDEVLAVLLELELEGWVRRYPGPSFARRC